IPRPCQVSHRPGSASTYSPWRRSSSWRSSDTCVSGSGRAPHTSHLNTTETGMALLTITGGELGARLAPLRLDVVRAPDPPLPQVPDDGSVREPRGSRVQACGGIRLAERQVLVREPRHRARPADSAHVGTT